MNQDYDPEFYQDLLTRVINLRTDTPQKVLTLAISGPDCAGKTTTARWLLENLHERKISASVINGDTYIRGPQQRNGLPSEAEGYYRHGFDFDRMLRDLATLKLQVAADSSDQTHVIIVEGVFLLKSDISQNWDAAFWIDDSDIEIMKRGIRRDADYYGSEAKAAAMYERQFIPAQRLHRNLDNPEAKATATYSGLRAKLNDWPSDH